MATVLCVVGPTASGKTKMGVALAQRFNGDPAIACSGLLNNIKVFTTRVFSSIALICVLFYTSWQLAIIAIVVLGSSLWPLASIRKRIKDIVKKSQIHHSDFPQE